MFSFLLILAPLKNQLNFEAIYDVVDIGGVRCTPSRVI